MSVLRFDPFGDPFRQMDRLTNQLLSGTRTPMDLPTDVWPTVIPRSLACPAGSVQRGHQHGATRLTIDCRASPGIPAGSERTRGGAASRKLHAAVAIGRHGGLGERPGEVCRRGPHLTLPITQAAQPRGFKCRSAVAANVRSRSRPSRRNRLAPPGSPPKAIRRGKVSLL